MRGEAGLGREENLLEEVTRQAAMLTSHQQPQAEQLGQL